MKLILLTSTFGGRVFVTVEYSNQVYFEDPQPPENSLVTIDLPGLRSAGFEDVLNWIKENHPLPPGSRRELNRFPENCWRHAVLDDYLEVGNFQESVWQIYNHFPARSFAAFGDKWLAVAQEKLKNALQLEVGDPRIDAFSEIRDFVERVYYVMDKTPQRLDLEIEEMLRDLENAKFREIRKQSDDLSLWIETAESFRSDQAAQNALSEISAEFKNRRLSSEEILQLLGRFGRNLRHQTQYGWYSFWTNITSLIKLEPNLTGAEIDLTNFNEEAVQMSWDLIFGKRVGTVTPGRTALVGTFPEEFSGSRIYISGERKLKFQVQQKGGRLEKFGCTLTLQKQEDNHSIQPALLEVEKIDALANLNLDQALEKIAHLDLPPNHLVYYTAEKAKTDPRQARVLADLLIELLVGVDADIARQLARSQTRGNRRR